MTEVEDRINKKKLHELYCANGDVQVVLDHFANRERNQNTSTVARLMANIPSLSRPGGQRAEGAGETGLW